MSYANFKKTYWAKKIEKDIKRACTLADWCNTKFEGEAKKGERVKILGLGKPTIKKYVPGKKLDAPEVVDDNSMFLEIDQFDYFNITIGDIDKAQATGYSIMDANLENAADEFALVRDKYVGSLAQYSDYINSATSAITTAAKAKEIVDASILTLRENDVTPGMETIIEMPWFMYNKFRDHLVELKTNNDELIKKGIISMYDGCYVRPSNNIFVDKDGAYYGMIRTHDAIAFAGGLDEVEAYRPHDDFGDAVKGLNTFGAKIVRPKELSVFKVTKS